MVSAEWRGKFYAASQLPNQFSLWRGAGTWNDYNVTWNNQPGHYTGPTDRILGEVNGKFDTCPDPAIQYPWICRNITDWVRGWMDNSATNHGIVMNTGGYDSLFYMYADETYAQGNDSYLAITFNNDLPIPSQGQLMPVHGTTTMSPDAVTLTAPNNPDPNGDSGLQWWFRVGTDTGAELGQVINSGWLNSPSFRCRRDPSKMG